MNHDIAEYSKTTGYTTNNLLFSSINGLKNTVAALFDHSQQNSITIILNPSTTNAEFPPLPDFGSEVINDEVRNRESINDPSTRGNKQ